MVMSDRVLFARIGRMVHYAGPQSGDDKPVGGGEHNREKLGHEAFNFLDFDGMLYGFIQRRVNLQRIDPRIPKDADMVDGVTIIFVAPYPDGQKVVGWYKNAIVYRVQRPYPSKVKKIINASMIKAGKSKMETETFKSYWAEASVKDSAVLLPTQVRVSSSSIPRSKKGGFGQWNVSYVFTSKGARKREDWIDRVCSFVSDYKGINLLSEPEAEIPIEEEILEQRERAAGFQSNPIIRRAIELYAMEKAKRRLKRLGYGAFEDTSKRESYDYTCHKNGKRYFVEVKGTQLSGNAVILTKNEVAHAQAYPNSSILVVVHSVDVHNGPSLKVSQGGVRVHEQWRVCDADLTALQYQWRTPVVSSKDRAMTKG
jgi:hypothetical protein